MRKGLVSVFFIFVSLIFILSFVSAVPAPCTTQEHEDSSTYGIIGKVVEITCGETYEGYTGCKIEGDPKDILQRCVAKVKISEVLYGSYINGNYVEIGFSKIYQRIGEAAGGACAPGIYSETFEVGDKIRYYDSDGGCKWSRKVVLEEGTWFCNPDYYGDGDCDCGCGIEDIDCNTGGCIFTGCYNYECEYCFAENTRHSIGCPDEPECTWDYQCEAGKICLSGECVEPPECVPDCENKECGDDGCQGSCGYCDEYNEFCAGWECVMHACDPLPDACDGKECGSDGCTENACGTCDSNDMCFEGVCCVGLCDLGCEKGYVKGSCQCECIEEECQTSSDCGFRSICSNNVCVDGVKCGEYTLSNCPEGCAERCLSDCPPNSDSCPTVCADIPGSCYNAPCPVMDMIENWCENGEINFDTGYNEYGCENPPRCIPRVGGCGGVHPNYKDECCINQGYQGWDDNLNKCVGEEECGDYTYSNCPEETCTQRCISSYCGEPDEEGRVICTADCGDVPGSCVKKPEGPCPQYSPPSPDWCKDGTKVRGGYDENGCQLPPRCIPNPQEEICCKIYGYGAEMVEVNVRYEIMSKQRCAVPDDFVGGNREIVDDSYCEATEKKYRYAYWQCYSGEAERKGSSTSCKTKDTWKNYARTFCQKECNEDESKCGVDSFGVLERCYDNSQCEAVCTLWCEYGYVEGSCNCQCLDPPQPECPEPPECPNGVMGYMGPNDECPTHSCIVLPERPEKMCEITGGEWKKMNGCADSCAFERQSEDDPIACPTIANIDSCDCGQDMCWNGEKCESNEVPPIKTCEDSCALNDKCYPFGFRKSGDFCSEEGLFVEQQERWSECDNHFECNSNICVENECISRGVMQAIMDFIERLFRRSYNNANDVVEAI